MEADLREAIERGDYQPGDQLPPTRELQERYGVAYQTGYNVIARLRADGLVTSRRGAGVFVTSQPVLKRIERFHTDNTSYLDERITVRRATREDSRAARVEVGEPVLIITRTPHGEDEGSPVERTILAADETELIYRLPAELKV